MSYTNLTLHTDKYQINMMYAHFLQGTMNDKAVFETSFRKLPFGNGFAVFAGLERIVDYIRSLHFGDEEIAYLRTQEENYKEEFLDALREFRFTGNIYSVEEGTLVFPGEPLLCVEARIFEAQLVETAILNVMNYQTLIATKAARIKQVAPDDVLLEFGTRRAQEADAAIWGARATYIAGFHATSNMRAGMLFGIPAKGTHAHSWIQGHDTEEDAFRAYANSLPDYVTLLVDTYNTLKSGVPNAIKIAHELEKQGKRMNAIRLDSGDLAYLSQMARKMLDEAGLPYVQIVASNDLDEAIIANLKSQGAKIDVWGVGTKLITATDQPSLGGVYKLVAREKNGGYEPVIKISANPEKVSTPGFKGLYRIINTQTGKAEADYITLRDEQHLARGERIKLFDPIHPYIHKYIEGYEAIPLLKPIFMQGELVYKLPSLEQIRTYHSGQFELFWPQYLRKLNAEAYRVNLSVALWELKRDLIQQHQM
ncbi:nicotinate phosphoribosyltransferase [Bacillus sp. FJAT-26390]|uniref:nicotinate phosphoribosyltransferase n=1 Tax=Bacillus sp. FJAT-26390 TaxID=1743142 RepID=UPI000807C354|nr:nicotinate phosphoribosyltransferase [Bacillus sp. FJAT-26390]OBZ08722.1 nicotinate phosphoribosyltransferase [Bacillus sp. FJAT-26390]